MTKTQDRLQSKGEKLSQKSAKRTAQSIAAAQKGDNKKALRLANEAIDTGALTLTNAIRLIKLLGALGRTERAAGLSKMTLAQVDEAVAATERKNHRVLVECGLACVELGDEDKAEGILRDAQKLDPSDQQAPLQLLHIYLKRGEPDKVPDLWQPLIDNSDVPLRPVLFLAKALGQYGFAEHGLRALRNHAHHFERNKAAFDEAEAALSGIEAGKEQSELATELFDKFAENYDQRLEDLGNSGPEMIADMLVRLELPKKAELTVLDAGCGTGLCAPYLRPYAQSVHGCDISIPMLEQCRDKRSYDLLTRTDLSIAETYPEGQFDLVVSGDVFVYFGELGDVFRNIAAAVKPGGWFVFTVEDCSEDEAAQGFHLRTSGRHSHGLDYLSRVLVEAGFSKPRDTFTSLLRTEFRQPITGRAVAAQKLAALGFG